jgi:long-chain acyl-CoA synthetase
VSVLGAFAHKRLLLTGASGFLGKVWLAHLLEHLPETDLVLVLRPGGGRGGPEGRAARRLVDLLETSPAFRGLRERLGPAGLAERAAARVRVVAGDLGSPGLGLASEARAALGPIDLVVNLAGLTDLDPPPREALDVNVQGALDALELARELGAALLHVSTAYVAGHRQGLVPERPQTDYAPCPPATGFSARRELEDLRALLARAEAEADDQRVAADLAARAAAARRRLGLPGDAATRARFLKTERRRFVSERVEAETRERARSWGWPNLYTQTKSLAESLLIEQAGQVPLALARPAIVESSWRDPFPGWKEGLHTSAPITYALSEGPLRALPARADLVLDVIPVDLVARGLSLIGAALLTHPSSTPLVYHLGSSTQRPFPMRRVIELTALARRDQRGPRTGPLAWRELLDLDPAASGDGLYRATLPLWRRLARGGERVLSELARGQGRLAERAAKGATHAGKLARDLSSVEEAVERFRPFVLENACRFESAGVRSLDAELPPAERSTFGWDLGDLDWSRYWRQVHIPGLREWVYPRLEGKRPPRDPRVALSLDPQCLSLTAHFPEGAKLDRPRA